MTTMFVAASQSGRTPAGMFSFPDWLRDNDVESSTGNRWVHHLAPSGFVAGSGNVIWLTAAGRAALNTLHALTTGKGGNHSTHDHVAAAFFAAAHPGQVLQVINWQDGRQEHRALGREQLPAFPTGRVATVRYIYPKET